MQNGAVCCGRQIPLCSHSAERAGDSTPAPTVHQNKEWCRGGQHTRPHPPCSRMTEPSGAAVMSAIRPLKSRPTVSGSKYLHSRRERENHASSSREGLLLNRLYHEWSKAGRTGCKASPVVLPLDALVPKDVAVVAPGRVGDVDSAPLEEAGNEAGADAEGASSGERLQSRHTALMGDGKGVIRHALLLYDGKVHSLQRYCSDLHPHAACIPPSWRGAWEREEHGTVRYGCGTWDC